MKKNRLLIRAIILIVMAVAIGYTFYNHFVGDRGVVDAGDEAPNFALENLDGEKIMLEDWEGEGVYLNFWATYCAFCREKMGYLKEHYDTYRDKGVEVVSVNVDESTVQVERHQERANYPYPIAIDRGMHVSNAYGVQSLPSVFLIDETGEVIEHTVGAKTEEQVIESLEQLVPET
ncbi:thiol-disulfide oxidoreductase ResA [Texcoconibacillus texcoconensis]|uniref:Peroxiredoxin n=1 Tax=Texcoconibacillus texcoconensis TaxID=1095777 RepID=A0A840QNN6_9BACI|nr:thiol-disulfide oxidoreductase ResA [Texcoconibacillus texcoconensis]MBB5172951.1 peroxiredoxin [Texcoconibacillus texcoconensis]